MSSPAEVNASRTYADLSVHRMSRIKTKSRQSKGERVRHTTTVVRVMIGTHVVSSFPPPSCQPLKQATYDRRKRRGVKIQICTVKKAPICNRFIFHRSCLDFVYTFGVNFLLLQSPGDHSCSISARWRDAAVV